MRPSGEQAGGANNDFQRFSPGDNADRVLSASYQNKLIAGVERANRMTFGPGSDVIQFGPFSLKKGRRQKSPQAVSGALYIARLTEVDCVEKTAVGEILLGPCDGDLPGGYVDVVDEIGCNLTGPAELLEGKVAWITQVRGSATQYVGACHYAIVSMCCDSFAC